MQTASSSTTDVHRPYRAELLGELRLTVNGRAIDGFRTRKTAALLAYLALSPGRMHPREYLAELLWPERSTNAARHSLNDALSTLRRLTELPHASERRLLGADRYSVVLLREAVHVDVGEFESELRLAAVAATDADAIPHLQAAAALYRGELLTGFCEEWVFPEQQRLHEQYLTALDRLILALERQRDLHGALQFCLRALREDPWREQSHRNAIRLFWALGQPDLAMRQHAEMERQLGQSIPFDQCTLPPDRSETDSPSLVVRMTAPRPFFEPPGGAVPLGSRFYVEREADAELHAALERGDGVVLVKGPRQAGKTSLLARGINGARRDGACVAFAHLQLLSQATLASGQALFLGLAQSLSEQLDWPVEPSDVWDDRRSPGANLRRYLRMEVLSVASSRLVWALDEVDRVLQCADSDDVFGFLRSLHDERALDPQGPWGGLSIVMAYSTEAHLLIADAHQSPFNVGTRIVLEDFTAEQVADLNARHGKPLRGAAEIGRFMALVGGQPYLTRLGLFEMAARSTSLDDLEERSIDDRWVFGDHLMRLWALVSKESDLSAALADILAGRPCKPEAFYRLRSAGFVVGGASAHARIRCGLYERYFAQRVM